MTTDVHTPQPDPGAPTVDARDQTKEVARIAAFSDGVYAIAITLLALQLEIPFGDDVDVWRELGRLWPEFLSLAISFAVIGVYWVAHHRLFSYIERYDGRLIWLNLLTLFFIVIMPFTTSLVGEHGDAPVSVASTRSRSRWPGSPTPAWPPTRCAGTASAGTTSTTT